MSDSEESINREDILVAALEVLGLAPDQPQYSNARTDVLATADRFANLTQGHEQSAAFSEIRRALAKQKAPVDRLARDTPELARRLFLVLGRLGFDHDEAHAILVAQIELGTKLRAYSEQLSEILNRWPLQIGAKRIHRAIFGNPNLWLARECSRIYLEYRGKDGHGPDRSAYTEFVELVYEVGLGAEAPDNWSLKKYSNEVARTENRFTEIREELDAIETALQKVSSGTPEHEELLRRREELTVELSEPLKSWAYPL